MANPTEYWNITFLTASGKYRSAWVTDRKEMPGNLVWYVVVKKNGKRTREKLLCLQNEVSERLGRMNNIHCELEIV